jgi:DNA primase
VQIPQETIDTIRDRSDIAEVVAQYVELKRTGSNFKGLCPFHQEKTPSFVVSPDKQIYHCFGCNKGGNVFSFLMEIEGVTFPEAVRQLGQRCGVEVEFRRLPEEMRSQNEARFGANAFAGRFYHRMLLDGRVGARARKYLEGRGITKEAWTRFGLGFAPDSWDRLWKAARREGISNDTLVELKLVLRSEKSTGYYDYFRNRVMFPILSVSGRVQGFGARALGDGVEPKYLNSAESPVFAKRRTFFGLNLAREPIRSRQEAVVVEGYTDLIAFHGAGIENTLAACGTAVTHDHATVLRRMTRRVVLVPDGDDAGENAAISAGALLLAEGLEVRVARLEAGSDPDTTARGLGSEALSELIGNSPDYFVFLEDIVRERKPTLREQEELIEKVMSGLARLDDRLRTDVIVKELSRLFGVDPQGLLARQARRSGTAAGAARSQAGTERSGGNREALERLALRLITEGTPAAMGAIDSLDSADFSDERLREFYKLLDLARETHIDIRSREFHRKAEEAGLEGLAAEIALSPLPPGNVEILLKDTIRRIKELNIRDELSELRRRLNELPPDSEEAVAVAEYYHKLKQALVEL